MAPISGVPVTVCRHLDVAFALVHGGAQVVLCRPGGDGLGEAVADLRSGAAPGARVAVLVGDLAEPETEAAAVAMARELFGGDPPAVVTVVTTLSAALQLGAHLPGSRRGGSGTV